MSTSDELLPEEGLLRPGVPSEIVPVIGVKTH